MIVFTIIGVLAVGVLLGVGILMLHPILSAISLKLSERGERAKTND